MNELMNEYLLMKVTDVSMIFKYADLIGRSF